MKFLWISAAALLMSVGHAYASAPFVEMTFDDACKQAKSEGKVVLIDFYTDWCGPCKLLDRTTWTDKDVIAAFSEKAIAVRVDAEKESAFAKRYSVVSFPMVLLVKPNGQEIDRLAGYRDPTTFLHDFPGALAGVGEVSRAREALLKSGSDDVKTRMALGNALREHQDNAGALEQYLQCLNLRSATEPFTKFRLFTELCKLSSDYPPARVAIETLRDEQEKILLTTHTQITSVDELVYLNTALKSPERNLALFDRLPHDSKAHELLRHLVIEQLVAAKRYQDVLDGENPTDAFEKQMARISPLLSIIGPARQAKLEPVRAKLSAGPVAYFQALLGVGKIDEGTLLAERILKIDPTAATLAQLIRAADEAGHPSIGNSLSIPR